VSGYGNLLRENNQKVQQILILRIGRDESEGFEEKYITPKQEKLYFGVFKHLVSIYYLKKEIGWR